MNWLEAVDTIEGVDSLQVVFKSMERLNVGGKALTYDNISEASQPHLTTHQIEGILRRFRAKYQKDKAFTMRAKIIASHFGAKGERKLLG